MFLHVQRPHLHLVTVEGHQVRLYAEGTRLVQSATAGGSTQLTEIGDVHLAHRVEVQAVELVESPCHKHTDSRR